MDILESLKKNENDIIIEDLDFYETELYTGNYSPNYINECMEYISNLRIKLNSKNNIDNINNNKNNDVHDVLIKYNLDRFIVPNNSKLDTSALPDDAYNENFSKFYLSMKDYDDNVKINFVKDQRITESVIAANISIIDTNVLNYLLTIIKFSEKFLEENFFRLDHSLVAKKQLFSEEFFIKHFDELPYAQVLRGGINPWRFMNQRSVKLKSVLRLKGVKI